MIIVCYDFSDDRVRARFAKFLKKYGRKLQYSVYEVKNSQRILKIILAEVEMIYKKEFTGADSIIIFQICELDKKKIKRYGYACNEEKEVVYFE